LSRDPNVVIWESHMSATRIVLVLALVIITPLVLYASLRLWLRGEKSHFPDIDYAWKSGVEALRANGISMSSTPIFLILGSTQESQEEALLKASGIRLRVEGVPEGPAALHWYANPEAIFVFCTEVSVLGSFNASREKSQRDSRVAAAADAVPPPAPVSIPQAPAAASPAGVGDGDMPAVSPEGSVATASGGNSSKTAVAPFTTPPDAAPTASGGQTGDTSAPGSMPIGPTASSQQHRGTLVLDSFVEDRPDAADTPAPRRGAGPAKAGGGGDSSTGGRTVLSPGGGAPATAPSAAAPPASPEVSGPATDLGVRANVSAQQSLQQTQRLQYVCRLLSLARQPLCPVNGMLTLLPFEAVQAAPTDVQKLQRAVKSDLTTIQRELQLRSPVSALVIGLEDERGFRELVRRVGRDRAAAQRFGRRFEVRALATPDELRALSAHVCGAFEDWIYTLFREHGSLSRPGNTRLYSLLCKVRCTLKPRLSGVLGEGFGYDARFMSDDDRIPFSGCYFAATGATPDRQAFVRGVIDKLIDEQEQVEWTGQALRSDRWYRRLTMLGIIVNLVLLISIGAIFFLW
jgi:hypothetical protein